MSTELLKQSHEILSEILGCPRSVDEATIPRAGIESAPNQVVFNMSIALPRVRRAQKLVSALEQAIEQVEKQEPVAWMWQHDETGRTGFVDMWQLENGWEKINPRLLLVCPLYAAPPKPEWVVLTKEEIDAWQLPDSPTVFEFVQFIEAKLKEKNHG
jgi:hypothetical protein